MPLHALYRNRRQPGDGLGQLRGALAQVVGGQQFGQEPARQHLGRLDPFGGQEQALGRVQAQPRHVAAHAALIEMQAQARGRHEHLHGVGAEPEVARQRQIRATTVDAALDFGDGDCATILHRIDQRLETCATLAGGELADIEPAAEVLARAAQDQHAHIAAIHGFDVLQQRLQVVRTKPVRHIGALKCQRGHVGGNVERGKRAFGSHASNLRINKG
ncbi:hypothetical protein D3C72_1587150 [compost metagenome]